jgi:hypothetical protein
MKGTHFLQDVDACGRIIPIRMDIKEVVCVCVCVFELSSRDSGQGPEYGSCGHGTEPSGSVKGCDFLVWLSDYLLLKGTDS